MLRKTGFLAFLATAAVAAAAPAAEAATFLNVGPNALCGQSGCFAGGKTFTQTYSASGHVAGLNLDRALLGANQNYQVKISFYDSAGNKVGDWGSYVVGVLHGQVVTLGGPAFDWNDANGDLTLRLDLVTPEKGGSGGGGFGGSGFAGGGPSGVGAFGGQNEPGANGAGGVGGGAGGPFGGQDGPPAGGIAPGLGTPPPGLVSAPPPFPPGLGITVPEPASWALMVMGFGAAGGLLRRNQRRLRHA